MTDFPINPADQTSAAPSFWDREVPKWAFHVLYAVAGAAFAAWFGYEAYGALRPLVYVPATDCIDVLVGKLCS